MRTCLVSLMIVLLADAPSALAQFGDPLPTLPGGLMVQSPAPPPPRSSPLLDPTQSTGLAPSPGLMQPGDPGQSRSGAQLTDPGQLRSSVQIPDPTRPTELMDFSPGQVPPMPPPDGSRGLMPGLPGLMQPAPGPQPTVPPMPPADDLKGFDGKGGGENKEEEAEEAKRSQRFWVRGEYLFWYIRDANLPVLMTLGPATDPRPGALGAPGTSVLFGGSGDYLNRSGARFFAGYWFDDQQRLGIEVSYFFLAGMSVGDGFTSPGNPVLARPFFNTSTGLQDSSIVAFPGVSNGTVVATTGSFLQGAELNLTSVLMRTEHFRLEALGGFRYLNLNESVQIGEVDNIAVSPYYAGTPIPYAGDNISVNDYFATRNNFFGAQIGGRAEFTWKRLSIEFVGKVALGATSEAVNIYGSTTIGAASYNSGLLALASNSGQYARTTFSVVPEAGINLGFQLTNNIRLSAGYSFLYWSNIVRPGDQIDTNINPNLVPTSATYGMPGGPSRPTFEFRSTDFFAHGANFGVEFRY